MDTNKDNVVATKDTSPIVRKLSQPVELGERTLTEITIPHPDDVEAWVVLEAIEGNNASTILALLASASGEPYALVRKIKMPDMNFLRPHLNEMLGNAQS